MQDQITGPGRGINGEKSSFADERCEGLLCCAKGGGAAVNACELLLMLSRSELRPSAVLVFVTLS